jgi:hypothetical protein
MKAGPGTKFAHETGTDPARDVSSVRQIADAELVRETGVRLLKATQ